MKYNTPFTDAVSTNASGKASSPGMSDPVEGMKRGDSTMPTKQTQDIPAKTDTMKTPYTDVVK